MIALQANLAFPNHQVRSGLFPADGRKFRGIKSAQRFRPDIARSGQSGQAAENIRFLFGAEKQNAVTRAGGPKLSFHFHPGFGRDFAKSDGTSGRFIQGFRSLGSELKQGDITHHNFLSVNCFVCDRGIMRGDLIFGSTDFAGFEPFFGQSAIQLRDENQCGGKDGRSDRIRTCDFLVPNQAL